MSHRIWGESEVRIPTTWDTDWDYFGAADCVVITLDLSLYCFLKVLIVTSVSFTQHKVQVITILFKYYKFADIFSKAKAETLASYYLYNIQIKLKNEKNLSIRTIYSLSTTKQEVLKEFISRNLNTRFIHLISFPHRVPVLFIKKKDSFLHLHVDF